MKRSTTPTTLVLRGWAEDGELRVVVTEVSGDEGSSGTEPGTPRLVGSLAALAAEVERWAASLLTDQPSR